MELTSVKLCFYILPSMFTKMYTCTVNFSQIFPMAKDQQNFPKFVLFPKNMTINSLLILAIKLECSSKTICNNFIN